MPATPPTPAPTPPASASATTPCAKAGRRGLDAWPDPDAVFIGGSGGELAGLIA
jgi:precorrin-6B methylase 2